MTNRNRIRSLAVTVLVASVVLAGGRARAATITHFEGQFSGGPASGPNLGISTAEPDMPYAAGTGMEQIFYLSFGTVSNTVQASFWDNQPLNNLTVDVSTFTAGNLFGSVTAFGMPLDSTLLQVGTTVPLAPHADFDMAATAKITSKVDEHRATIEIGVTLRGSSVLNGDDLTAFITAGGGTFTLDIDNIDIQPTLDGTVLFPVDPGKRVTVNWSINPVPEPSSAVSMLIGAGLLALWARRRTKPKDEG
jgi:hypothetical protein